MHVLLKTADCNWTLRLCSECQTMIHFGKMCSPFKNLLQMIQILNSGLCCWIGCHLLHPLCWFWRCLSVKIVDLCGSQLCWQSSMTTNNTVRISNATFSIWQGRLHLIRWWRCHVFFQLKRVHKNKTWDVCACFSDENEICSKPCLLDKNVWFRKTDICPPNWHCWVLVLPHSLCCTATVKPSRMTFSKLHPIWCWQLSNWQNTISFLPCLTMLVLADNCSEGSTKKVLTMLRLKTRWTAKPYIRAPLPLLWSHNSRCLWQMDKNTRT